MSPDLEWLIVGVEAALPDGWGWTLRSYPSFDPHHPGRVYWVTVAYETLERGRTGYFPDPRMAMQDMLAILPHLLVAA
jgi:hypothetical protein